LPLTPRFRICISIVECPCSSEAFAACGARRALMPLPSATTRYTKDAVDVAAHGTPKTPRRCHRAALPPCFDCLTAASLFSSSELWRHAAAARSPTTTGGEDTHEAIQHAMPRAKTIILKTFCRDSSTQAVEFSSAERAVRSV